MNLYYQINEIFENELGIMALLDKIYCEPGKPRLEKRLRQNIAKIVKYYREYERDIIKKK